LWLRTRKLGLDRIYYHHPPSLSLQLHAPVINTILQINSHKATYELISDVVEIKEGTHVPNTFKVPSFTISRVFGSSRTSKIVLHEKSIKIASKYENLTKICHVRES